MRKIALGLLAATALAGAAHAQVMPITTVFVIAMENHDFTQPSTYASIQPILGNSAAPYINSLMTPNNSNSQYTSYETNNLNVAAGVHPSEPNYIWGIGGSNFGVASDNTPSAASHNIVSAPSLATQLTAQGVTWNSYQEDVQYSTSPTANASGTGGVHNGNTVAANPYYGTTQYNYAVKHDPMAFFADTINNPNSYLTFGQLQTDLQNNTYAQFNWITPNQYDDMHSALSTAFTYNNTTYAANTDQEAVALGDNFLSQIVPQIERTQAFQHGNAVIDLWWDESEGGDTSSYTIPEIIISKDAVGNAYDATGTYTHSSNLLTWQEIFQTQACLQDSCNATDQSALFDAGAIPDSVPEPASMALLATALLATAAARRRRAG
jgi:hypothetical protein